MKLKDTGWVQELAFMVDIREHLYYLNTKIQGRNKLVSDRVLCLRSCLQLFERQLPEENLSHFPTSKSLQGLSEFHDDINTGK